MEILLVISGIFTLSLGIIHIFLPLIVGYKKIIYSLNDKLKSINLIFTSYKIKLSDLHGIIWIMNNHASYVLISIGLVNIFFSEWLLNEGKLLCLWIGLWWLLRSFNQFFLGKRLGDYVIILIFLTLAIIHFGGYLI